jgi:hypothetical protein
MYYYVDPTRIVENGYWVYASATSLTSLKKHPPDCSTGGYQDLSKAHRIGPYDTICSNTEADTTVDIYND